MMTNSPNFYIKLLQQDSKNLFSVRLHSTYHADSLCFIVIWDFTKTYDLWKYIIANLHEGPPLGRDHSEKRTNTIKDLFYPLYWTSVCNKFYCYLHNVTILSRFG